MSPPLESEPSADPNEALLQASKVLAWQLEAERVRYKKLRQRYRSVNSTLMEVFGYVSSRANDRSLDPLRSLIEQQLAVLDTPAEQITEE